ncbi:major facilitator superfamily transporter [Grosmannia clavigera kw1407]|uniref:Major facilitator superfamily transporter n=1 Tax=Grosmannia clavigera (strain kw1407 / UAMH 11150) TaxID=655863 RepID=F0XQB1_GROCL|nr:major facilitator superfamily transporter [Grosmannia clavigera kw1407]EFX00195.1 major facilitator superfamily transporter [Grosmannia clavigera kw1407]
MALSIMHRLPFARSTTPLQAATYLLGISLFSISFLVFLNSSISFVITDRIGVKNGVGDIVGTLGFVDELVALVACPVWGLVSDRLGVRLVAVIGYAVIALALVLTVTAVNVYPQLLLARILFAIGATAAATMVTAILPSLTAETADTSQNDDAANSPPKTRRNPRDSALSMESQLTITPERFAESQQQQSRADSDDDSQAASKPGKLAGFVGVFTGCGALVALSLFLPLPAQFGRVDGITMAEAVAHSFYVVALVALFIAVFVFFGLRGLRGEEGKGWHMLLGHPSAAAPAATSSPSSSRRRTDLLSIDEVLAESRTEQPPSSSPVPYWRLLRDSVRLGFTDADIALGYLGGFVARASTVAISLFVPLFVNAFFIRNGYCQGSPHDSSPELKEECRAAYVLASILTGVAQLMGLLCAPLFGYLSSHRPGRVNVPIVVASLFGVAGYLLFALLPSPEFSDEAGRGGSPIVFLAATLIGISQIGAIVCSLGALGKGVLASGHNDITTDGPETAPLLGAGLDGSASYDGVDAEATTSHHRRLSSVPGTAASRIRLKGSIAGMYSWCGGAAILLLTKLGGYLFDHWTTAAPFYLMAAFNVVLLVASVSIDVGGAVRRLSR